MINVIYAADLYRLPLLAASMYRDRAVQFKERLGWAVNVDEYGHEFDDYDDLNPLYVILQNARGEHLGSGRLMPTTGRTMLNDHFQELTGGVSIESPLIWETTRFCVSPRVSADRRLAVSAPATLLWAGCEIALRSGIEFYAGVFAEPMLRIYKAAGWMPEVLGSRYTREGTICAGLWEVTATTRDRLAVRARRSGKEPELRYLPDEDRFPSGTPLSAANAFAVTSALASYL
jgi:acyl homoserine lactone synthase